jgi:hypothetical protein
MRGSLKERSRNHWAIILEVRDPQTGRRRRRWHSFKGTRREAETERARLITELQKGTAAEPSRLTVASFLEKWLEYIKPQVAPKTVERYAGLIRANINPALGNVRLSKLQPITISAAYSAALAHLAPRTVQHMHRVLSQACKQAVRWRLLPRNPLRSAQDRATRYESVGCRDYLHRARIGAAVAGAYSRSAGVACRSASR